MKVKVIFLITLIIFSSSLTFAGNSFFPWDFTINSQGEEDSSFKNTKGRFASILVRFFSEFISPVDGPRCVMYPTCASYSLNALEKHGFFWGTLLTIDRLIHEGDEIRKAPSVKIGDRMRYWDPVENNDFWLILDKKEYLNNFK